MHLRTCQLACKAQARGVVMAAAQILAGFTTSWLIQRILHMCQQQQRSFWLRMQVPNALLAEVKGTPGGCSAISISRDGRWLAAACGDDKGRFKVGQAWASAASTLQHPNVLKATLAVAHSSHRVCTR